MSGETHDPGEFAAGLGAKLATRSRHVCTLLGAGVSRACGLPDVSKLETAVAGALGNGDRERFEELLEGRNLEEVLSRLRRIATLLEDEQELGGLNVDAAKDLDAAICSEIVKQLSLEKADLDPMRRFAAWASRASWSGDWSGCFNASRAASCSTWARSSSDQRILVLFGSTSTIVIVFSFKGCRCPSSADRTRTGIAGLKARQVTIAPRRNGATCGSGRTPQDNHFVPPESFASRNISSSLWLTSFSVSSA